MTGATLLIRTDEFLSWGRVCRAEHRVSRPAFRTDVEGALRDACAAAETSLAVGLGRSYGVSGLNPGGALIDMTSLDRLIAFDPGSGTLRAEAGVSLWDILQFAVPKGFFLPTTPGTRFVTLGGAIANDVHGKNHHNAGTIGCHVRRIGLLRTDAGFLEVSPDHHSELFAATIGGLGLTGVMLWAEIELVRIPSSRISQQQSVFRTLEEFFDLADRATACSEHTMAWIDCFSRAGRGVFTSGSWHDDGEHPVSERGRVPGIPFEFPEFVLNGWSIRAFNLLYRLAHDLKSTSKVIEYGPFFYPLDSIGSWNRMYGRRGFYQYQSVVPGANALESTREMLEAIRRYGHGSFLAVLKTFGSRPSPGLLSFPREGVTLALDFPNRGAKTLELMEVLDAIVAAAGGRLYPAKDGRMPASMMRSGYPLLDRYLQQVDPALSSGFLARLREA